MTEPQPQEPAAPTEPTVRHHPNGWDLITAGVWEISIAPDGLIHLPRHLVPDEVDDFIAALGPAVEYAARKRAADLERARLSAANPRVAVHEGGIQTGASRMLTTTRANAAAIGRPRGT